MFLKCLLASRLTLFNYLQYFGLDPNHCILSRLLWSKNRAHSSSNCGWCYLSSYRSRLCL